MSIKSGELASASDLNALKSALLTLYANRTVSTNGRQLSSTTTAPYSTVNAISATAGNSISAAQKGVIDGILVINDLPNLLTQAQNNEILANGVSSTTLLDWVNQYKNVSGISDNHGCRGACVGICTRGCAEQCQGGCAGCSTLCQGSCKNGCGNNCSRTCSNSCTISSGLDASGIDCNGCHGSCYTSCNGCSATCKNGCAGWCDQGCQETCDDGCATDCTSRCYGNATGGCYGCSGTNNA